MKKTTFLVVIAVLGLFLNTSCKKEAEVAAAPAATIFDLTAAKASIDENYRAFETAFNAKDSVALANCYATDGKFMAPNMKAIEGKAEIQKTFGMWFKDDTSKIKLNLVELWGNESNLTAENAWTISDKDGKVLDEGKSIEVYKMEDGKWKMLRDCYNSNMPAMPMTK
jgi:ketosteroid isomerase-like protein